MATSLESVQLVDQSHPARSLVAEEVLDRRLLQPLHAFPTGLLPKRASVHFYMFPFPVSWALSRAVEYYGNSVAMSFAACRRSRIDTCET